MADFALDWNAGSNMNPQGPLGVVNQSYTGAEEGYKLGQTGAIIHALQGIDLNNPDSVNAGIGSLVKANGLEQAGALNNLQFSRYLRSQLPAWIQQFQDIAAGKGPAPTEGGVSAAPGTTSAADQTGQTQDPQAHVLETYTKARDAAQTLADTPEDMRPQAFQKIKQDMLARGVPEEAIDAAGAHLAGDGPKDLVTYYQGLIDHQTGTAPAMPEAHPSAQWANRMLASPFASILAGVAKGAGIDLTPAIETAKALALPGIQQAAQAQYAGPIEEARQRAQLAVAPAKAGVEVAKQVAIEAGTNPYKAALAQAQADIAAQHDKIEVPEVGKDGQPTGRMVTYRKDIGLNKGATGQPIGISQSPGEQQGQTKDAQLFMDNYKADANQEAIQREKTARDVALAGAHMAQTLNPSNLTGWIGKNANTLNGLGLHIAAKDANNIATYQNIAAQNLKNATTVFPRIRSEMGVITDATANAHTPSDAAALAFTETAALHDQMAAYKQGRIDYAAAHPGEYSERAFQTWWNQQPQANQSIFASPLFRDLKFNGKPAVAVAPPFTSGPHAGQQWGVFMPGTPNKFAFRVR